MKSLEFLRAIPLPALVFLTSFFARAFTMEFIALLSYAFNDGALLEPFSFGSSFGGLGWPIGVNYSGCKS